ncbi:MAG TPA: hypothetical protein VLZ31_02085 [Microbacteriaceae bacterium]|nr:hypothetical protein [Microbacteriaceae bacterium]
MEPSKYPISRSASSSRSSRAVKGTVIAVASTVVAATSHILAGGNIPTPVALLVTAVVALPLVILLLSKRLGIAGMTAAVGFTQALFHTIFVYAGTGYRPGSGDPLPAHAAHMGMVEKFVPTAQVGSSADLMMLFGHAVATVLTVWLIRRGEVALKRIATSLRRIFLPTASLSASQTAALRPHKLCWINYSSKPIISSFLLTSNLSLRGPPVLTLQPKH